MSALGVHMAVQEALSALTVARTLVVAVVVVVAAAVVPVPVWLPWGWQEAPLSLGQRPRYKL